MKNDYALLRPFDPDLAVKGEAICNRIGTSIHSLISKIPDRYGYWPVWVDRRGGILNVMSDVAMRMAPLFWVEGKPVYKGDVLYSLVGELLGQTRTVTGVYGDNIVSTVERGERTCLISDLTWEQPKKRYRRYIYMMKDGTCYVECNELQPYELQSYQFEGIARVEVLEWEA